MNKSKKKAQRPSRGPGDGLQGLFGCDRSKIGVEEEFMVHENRDIRKLGDFPRFIFGEGRVTLMAFWGIVYPRWYE